MKLKIIKTKKNKNKKMKNIGGTKSKLDLGKNQM